MIKLMHAGEYHHIESSLSQLADGDFRVSKYSASVHPRSGLQPIVNRTIRSLKSLVRVVDHSSRALHRKMEDTSARSAMISEQVEGVTSTMREMAVGMQDASGYVFDIADEMKRIHHFLQDVTGKNGEIVRSSEILSSDVVRGSNEMLFAVEHMRCISDESIQVQERMIRLNQAIAKIAAMTSVIEEISSQTQLLALNANIEAARAGEHGKGFAVVAQEITKLAVQTKQGTSDIQEVIRTVADSAGVLGVSIHKIDAAIGTGVHTLETAVGNYQKVETFLGQIVSEIKEVDESLAGITSSTLSIADSVNQTSAMIQQVAAGSEEVLASVEIQQQNLLDINANIQESALQSLTLRSSVSQFRLPPPEDSHPLQMSVDQWIEAAMAIRAVMVAMIESREIESIQAWNRQKVANEAVLARCIEQLADQVTTEQDRSTCKELQAAWQQFDIIKDQNAKWMLEGEYDKAKQALMTEGRMRFKKAMDLAAAWMEGE
ncbi:methyl-accepting chemotaxis protein [Paenibacillus whitsoniae]|nr:methyl-accepting chemotaxis protein [Paenibacillus whitsoniae]